MIPVSLSLRNFLSYGDQVPPLDFTRFHVACLNGANGHGKSALLDADRILVAAGIGAEHRSPLTLIEGPFRWDAFAQVHQLAPGQLDRGARPNPIAGFSIDNEPLPIGGRIVAAGIQWGAMY